MSTNEIVDASAAPRAEDREVEVSRAEAEAERLRAEGGVAVVGSSDGKMHPETGMPPAREEEYDRSAPPGSRLNPIGLPVKQLTSTERASMKAKRMKVPAQVKAHVEKLEAELKLARASLEQRALYASGLEDVLLDIQGLLTQACASRGKPASLGEDEALEIIEKATEKLGDPATAIAGMQELAVYLGKA